MQSLDLVDLDGCQRARLEGALEADPELASELELIVSLLDSAARGRFWRAMAEGCDGHRRPAAAVLGALERAALGDQPS